MDSPKNSIDDAPEEKKPMRSIDSDGSAAEAEGAISAVTEDKVMKLFGSGLNFNECLRQLYPMTAGEIEVSRPESGLPMGIEEDVHIAIAREKLRATGLFSSARLAYIKAARDRYLEKAQELINNGQWKKMNDAAAYLINGEGDVECICFQRECTQLFDTSIPDESAQYRTFQDGILFPLRDRLDAMFAPLYAAMHLEKVQEYINKSRDGNKSQDGISGRVFIRDVNYSNALGALKRLAGSLEKARENHQGSSPITYFSVPAMPDGRASAPQITFSQAEEKAKELAKILIRTRYMTRGNDFPTKEEFSKNVNASLADTGFTLDNCGFGMKDTRGGFLGMKVVGFKLIEK